MTHTEQLGATRMALAAYLGHEPAQRLVDPEVLAGFGELRRAGPLERDHDPDGEWRLEDWVVGLSRWGREACVRAAIAIAEVDPDDVRSPTNVACLDAARAWVAAPGEPRALAAQKAAARHKALTRAEVLDAAYWAAQAAYRTRVAGAAGVTNTARAARMAIEDGRHVVTLIDLGNDLNRLERGEEHRPFTARTLGPAVRDALLPWVLGPDAASLDALTLDPAPTLEADLVFVPDGATGLAGCRLLARRGFGRGERPFRSPEGTWSIPDLCRLAVSARGGRVRVRRVGAEHLRDGAFTLREERGVHEGRPGTSYRCTCMEA